MTDREFVELVRRMRLAQNTYLLIRAPSDLNRAKALEREVDEELERRKMAEAPKQTTLF
ncbi:MAG TPA: hypothetical protein K8U76_02865 [Bilophila wadsworthia]|uniref:hypothetical protein n=1 Tax=Bilophila wadsworthia TaxID=35833 RepID=UPI001D207CA5|nr:hypothetical protein [Bilophila wadsworthia]HJH14194.1 hypothetical protein [Bilophila wadsworthia]